jgi:hypothetical protein
MEVLLITRIRVPAYIEGFNGGLAHNQNTCSDIPYNGSNTEKRDECIAGVINNTE